MSLHTYGMITRSRDEGVALSFRNTLPHQSERERMPFRLTGIRFSAAYWKAYNGAERQSQAAVGE